MPFEVVLGGARSGKSSWALDRAAQLGSSRIFIATAEALDDDMADRIARHKAERDQSWMTVEAPLVAASNIAALEDEATIVLDCLTLWTANHLGAETPTEQIVDQAGELAASLADRSGRAIVVTNEVGLGVVPATALGRRFRDVLGSVNRTVVGCSHRALLLVAGRAMELVEA